MTKGRIFLLFTGGILAGGAVVALVMNQFYQPEKTKAVKEKQVENTISSNEIKSKNIPLDSTGNYLDKKLPIRIKGDTSSDYYKNIDENSEVYDSLIHKKNSAEVSINRDRMLDSREIKIKYLTTEKNSAEDSLLNKMNAIKSGNKPAVMQVEIWESPIHYKGYKLGKNKMVIYGIDPSAEILLFDLNDYVLLQSGTQYYRLERTSDFKNLRKFNDQAVIARLK